MSRESFQPVILARNVGSTSSATLVTAVASPSSESENR